MTAIWVGAIAIVLGVIVVAADTAYWWGYGRGYEDGWNAAQRTHGRWRRP